MVMERTGRKGRLVAIKTLDFRVPSLFSDIVVYKVGNRFSWGMWVSFGRHPCALLLQQFPRARVKVKQRQQLQFFQHFDNSALPGFQNNEA